MSRIVKLGLVQMRCSESAAQNLGQAVMRIAKLARRGGQIVALPELFFNPLLNLPHHLREDQ